MGEFEERTPEAADFLRALLDPLRLAVMGDAMYGSVSLDSVIERTGASPREVAAAIGALRTAGLLTQDGGADHDVLRAIAESMPQPVSEPITGPWTDDEAEVLERFFDGGRLISVPGNATKRRLVIEKVATEFEPGVRYSERDVNFTIQLIHPDYAAIRRYLIDEGFMDRADGAYWRIGGRHSDSTPESVETLILPTDHPEATLRSYDLSMAGDLVANANDPLVGRYMSDRFPYPYTEDDAYDWITFASQQRTQMNLAVVVGGEPVGGVGLARSEGERTGGFEIGWWLSPRFWGQGLTSAAAGALLDHAFSNLGAMYVFAPVMHPNDASAGVARKIGMTQTGRHPSAYLKAGVRYDELVFSITRAQWSAER